MIIGVGIDIVDVREIAQRLPRIRGYFTEQERAVCDARGEQWAAYAKRFAAKEAAIKALGSNDALGGVGMHEIEVVETKSGRPTLVLTGGALRQLGDITPDGMVSSICVSIADHIPFAVANVVIWARPKRDEPNPADFVCP